MKDNLGNNSKIRHYAGVSGFFSGNSPIKEKSLETFCDTMRKKILKPIEIKEKIYLLSSQKPCLFIILKELLNTPLKESAQIVDLMGKALRTIETFNATDKNEGKNEGSEILDIAKIVVYHVFRDKADRIKHEHFSFLNKHDEEMYLQMKAAFSFYDPDVHGIENHKNQVDSIVNNIENKCMAPEINRSNLLDSRKKSLLDLANKCLGDIQPTLETYEHFLLSERIKKEDINDLTTPLTSAISSIEGIISTLNSECSEHDLNKIESDLKNIKNTVNEYRHNYGSDPEKYKKIIDENESMEREFNILCSILEEGASNEEILAKAKTEFSLANGTKEKADVLLFIRDKYIFFLFDKIITTDLSDLKLNTTDRNAENIINTLKEIKEIISNLEEMGAKALAEKIEKIKEHMKKVNDIDIPAEIKEKITELLERAERHSSNKLKSYDELVSARKKLSIFKIQYQTEEIPKNLSIDQESYILKKEIEKISDILKNEDKRNIKIKASELKTVINDDLLRSHLHEFSIFLELQEMEYRSNIDNKINLEINVNIDSNKLYPNLKNTNHYISDLLIDISKSARKYNSISADEGGGGYGFTANQHHQL